MIRYLATGHWRLDQVGVAEAPSTFALRFELQHEVERAWAEAGARTAAKPQAAEELTPVARATIRLLVGGILPEHLLR